MGQAALRSGISPEEYLAFERASKEKHEYADGEIYAMSGGTREHSLIGANILRELGNALLDRPCEVHGSDMRVKIAATGRYTYPDVSVVCGRPQMEDEVRDTLLNPKILVEVLSDSTESYDRGVKFAQYRTIESLRDYVLVSQKQVLVEHYTRKSDGSWIYRDLGPGERLELDSVGVSMPVERVYLKVFDPPSGEA